eukprot:sb/3460634/
MARTHPYSNNRHKRVVCPTCNKPMRSDKLGKHLLTHNTTKECRFCKNPVREDRLLHHETLCQDKVDESVCGRSTGVHEHMDNSVETLPHCSSVSGFFRSYELNVEKSIDYDKIIEDTCSAVKHIVTESVKRHPIKAQISISLSFYKDVDAGDNVDEFLKRAAVIIRHGIDVYERFGSGWIFDSHQCSKLELAKYSPLSASGFVRLPKKLRNMKSLLNIRSNDNHCFLYCILAHLFPVKSHPDRYTKYLEHVDRVAMGDVQFPVKLKDIPKIEQMNNLSISVFQWCRYDVDKGEEECVIPLKHGSGHGTQIDLLYVEDEDTSHYLLIKSFNSFMRHRTKHHNSMFYCRKCLHGFVDEKKQKAHTEMCIQGINQITVMPKPGFIEFDAKHKQDEKLFRIYYDFECLTVPYSTCVPSGSSTTKVQKHVPCAFSIVAVSKFPEYKEEPVVFSHPDPLVVTQKFTSELSRIHDNMMKCYEKNQHPIHMTKADEKAFKSSKTCHICKKDLCWESDTNYPVRDHDHTKKLHNFRGSACNSCNRNYFNRTKRIPAFAHNMKGYDLNLFIRDLIRSCEEEAMQDEDLETGGKSKISLIPENLEKIKAVFTEKEDRLFHHETLCQDKVDESVCGRSTGVHEHMDDSVETLPHCSSVSGFFRSYELDVEKSIDYDKIIEDTCSAVKQIVTESVKKHPIKAQISISLSFYKDVDGQRNASEKVFRSQCEPIIAAGDNVDEFLKRAAVIIRHGIDVYERFGSGWIFDSHQCSNLEIAKYSPLSASGFVRLPKKLRDMKSLLNIRSNDNRCFLYCLLAHMFPVKTHAERYTKYLQHVDKVTMGDVQFPVKLKDIPKIEQMNNLSISVFQWCRYDVDKGEEECVIPLKHGSGHGTQIDLLYVEDEDTSHYLLIKSFNSFMRHRTKHHNSMFYCRKCLHGFVDEKKQKVHTEMCIQGINQITVMPKPGFIEFDAKHKQDEKLFRIYYDFECLTVPYSTCVPSGSSTTKVQKHVPCAFSIVAVSKFPEYKEEPVVFSHPDPLVVTQRFTSELSRIHDNMMKCYEKNQHPIHMTKADEKAFKSSKTCHICKKDLCWESDTNYPVRDHDHTKKLHNFRGSACNSCNRNYFNRTKRIPAFAHNMKGYDLNLFIRDLIRSCEEEAMQDEDLETGGKSKISLIPENLEKIKAVFTEKFTFLDSFAFMSTSLDKLAKNLKTSGIDKFTHLKQQFPDQYKLLSEKGVFFYDYASTFDVFEEKVLPAKESFYSQLTETHISDKEYERAQEVYKTMECKSLLDYMELYVLTDTLQLCDIFENFRDMCLNSHYLDPCHYVSLPAFAWDAMLRMTGVKLEVLTDIDMYTFVEQGLRGGVTTVNHRYFKANNWYLENFDPEVPSSFIHYVDANNLYGAAMMNKMPTKNFRWLEEEEIESFDVLSTSADRDKCYILEVDLEYPEALHDYHTDFPLAVEGKQIQEAQLSDYNRQFLEQHGEEAQLSDYNRQFLEQHGETFSPSRKLVPDLNDKTRYTCSLKNLQLFLKHGLVLNKIHRDLVADQEDFMTKYISYNSAKRQQATDDFSKDFWKLCNNAVYGKFIESVRNRTDVKVVTDEKMALKLTSKPQYLGMHRLDDDIALVQCTKRKIVLNKPITCGFMVLENAKHIMYEFWYDVLKPRYGSNIKLMLSDTDSFVYAVYTEDGYKDLFEMKELMDLAGYHPDTALGKFRDPENKKVPGKFSDEMPTSVIREVVSLKPKMYSIATRELICPVKYKNPSHLCVPECEMGHSARAKGVSSTAKKHITHEDYKRTLFERGTTMTKSRAIRTLNNELYSVEICKRGLSAFDDKKFILEDGISTLSYGHYKLKRTDHSQASGM